MLLDVAKWSPLHPNLVIWFEFGNFDQTLSLDRTHERLGGSWSGLEVPIYSQPDQCAKESDMVHRIWGKVFGGL